MSRVAPCRAGRGAAFVVLATAPARVPTPGGSECRNPMVATLSPPRRRASARYRSRCPPPRSDSAPNDHGGHDRLFHRPGHRGAAFPVRAGVASRRWPAAPRLVVWLRRRGHGWRSTAGCWQGCVRGIRARMTVRLLRISLASTWGSTHCALRSSATLSLSRTRLISRFARFVSRVAPRGEASRSRRQRAPSGAGWRRVPLRCWLRQRDRERSR